MPRTLSVVMANYNHGELIARAIEAVASQSRPPDEYIILDDGSTDNSVRIVESYARRFPFIRLERNDRNMGALPSIQRVLGMATCEYLYAGAADDYVLPGFFERAMDMADQYPDAGIVFGKAAGVDEAGNTLWEAGASRWQEPVFASPGRFLQEYLDVEPPNHSLCGATIYRLAALNELGGFRKELEAWCDTFVSRAIGLKYGGCYVPELFMSWTVSQSSLSGRMKEDSTAVLAMISTAAQLMRSERYRDLFPETHVARWEAAYRDHVIAGAAGLFKRHCDEAADVYWDSMTGTGHALRILRRIGMISLRAGSSALGRWIRWNLGRC